MEGLETIIFNPPVSCYSLVNCSTGAIDYVLNGTSNGVILSQNLGNFVGEITVGTETIVGCWNIQINSDPSCTGFRSDIALNGITSSSDNTNYCGCPTGYTYDPIKKECFKTTTQNAQTTGNLLEVCAGSKSFVDQYGDLGTVFYTNLDPLAKPLKDVALSLPLPSPLPLPAGYLYTQNNILINPAYTLLPTSSAWPPERLEDIGVWANSAVGICDEWIGFSRCVTIPTTGKYCIGIAGDNRVRLKIDGQVILSLENSGLTYRSWNIFEFTLAAGTRIIELEGYNNSSGGVCAASTCGGTGGNPAAFAAEIYNATAATLYGFTTAAQVQSTIIFTTKDLRPPSPQTNPPTVNYFQTGETTGYFCPDGYATNFCGATPTCTITQTVPVLNCCYELVNCDTGDVDYTFNYNNYNPIIVQPPDDPSLATPKVISSITVGTETFTGCWSIRKSTAPGGCIPSPTTYNWSDVTAINTAPNCETCLPSCYMLHDCKGVQYDILVKEPDLGPYLGKTINITITNSTAGGWPNGNYCAEVLDSSKVCDDAVTLAIDLPNIEVFDSCQDCDPPCFLLTNCADQTDFYTVSTDLTDYVGGVITLLGCEDICWIVQYAQSCDGAIPISAIVNYYPPVGDPGNKCCYKFQAPTNYNGSLDVNGTIYPVVATSLAQLISNLNITLVGLGLGYAVLEDPGTGIGNDAIVCIIGNENYGKLRYNNSVDSATKVCTNNSVLRYCSYQPFDYFTVPVLIKIKITINDVQYVSAATSLSLILDYLNSLNLGVFTLSFNFVIPVEYIINVEGLNDYGNIIIENATSSGIIYNIPLDQCIDFTDTSKACSTCNPPEPVVPPQYLKPRFVKPNYTTPVCSPEYTEKVNCTFGEAMYEEVISKRYGLKDCCTIDAIKWTIKKELLDIKTLLDPNFVTPIPVDCYCYELTAISEDLTFKYINCDGCLVTVLVTEGDTEYVCSRSYPKVDCPPVGAQYSIIEGKTTCTSNNDCQPQPPTTCNCYYINLELINPMTVSYTECGSTLPTQKTLIGKTENWVCSSTPVIRISGEDAPIFNLGNCTDIESPCNCKYYKIDVIEPTIIQATLCGGGTDPVEFLPGINYLCVANIPGNTPVILDGQATITLEPGPCPSS